jgi:hypothetical protein
MNLQNDNTPNNELRISSDNLRKNSETIKKETFQSNRGNILN